jgi:hypothetical protein
VAVSMDHDSSVAVVVSLFHIDPLRLGSNVDIPSKRAEEVSDKLDGRLADLPVPVLVVVALPVVVSLLPRRTWEPSPDRFLPLESYDS